MNRRKAFNHVRLEFETDFGLFCIDRRVDQIRKPLVAGRTAFLGAPPEAPVREWHVIATGREGEQMVVRLTRLANAAL